MQHYLRKVVLKEFRDADGAGDVHPPQRGRLKVVGQRQLDLARLAHLHAYHLLPHTCNHTIYLPEFWTIHSQVHTGYNTWLLIKLTPKGVFFSVLLLSSHVHAVVDGKRIQCWDVCLRSQVSRHGAMFML